MLDKIKNFLEQALSDNADAKPMQADEAYRLASAALMVEVIAADYEQEQEEKDEFLHSVCRQFGLDEAEGRELIDEAIKHHHQSTDYYRFTAQLNELCTPEQKVSLLEALWRIAYADQELHRYEEHVIRRIADLLHIPHVDFIATKLRAQQTMSDSPET